MNSNLHTLDDKTVCVKHINRDFFALDIGKFDKRVTLYILDERELIQFRNEVTQAVDAALKEKR